MGTRKVAKNTAILYVRMMFVMIINLYTVRVVLRALGMEDYGIYDVVAGVVTMLQSISGVLSASSQRFMAYAIGENNHDELKKIYTASLNIFLAFSLAVVLLGEPLGIYVIKNHLVIPPERLTAALWVFHFAILTFITTLVSSTFSAETFAHEDIGVFAVISTAECILKLVFALLISTAPFDKLIYYAGYLFAVHLISLVGYFWYCKKHYSECKYKRFSDKTLYKRFLSFSGWIFMGSLAGIGINQGCAILVNLFFGPVANAARAIAFQVSNAMMSLTGGFTSALRPAMIKSYASEEYREVNVLFSFSNKFVCYILAVVCIPLVLEMPTILNLWLGDVGSETIIFSRLMVVYTFVLALNNPISFIVQATGNVKTYEIVVEGILLLCVPITYLFYHFGLPSYTVFISMILTMSCAHIARIICLKRVYSQFSYRDYIVRFVMPASIIILLSSVALLFVHNAMEASFMRLLLVCVCSVAIVFALVYAIGLSGNERALIASYVRRFNPLKKNK